MKKIDKDIIEDILALTPMQEGMLFHYLKEHRRDLYFEQLSLELSGFLAWNPFEKAWNNVVQANQILRTFFRWEKLDKPTQVVLKQHSPDIRFFDLSTVQDQGQQRLCLEKIKQEDREKGFDLREVPFRVTLCKISETDHYMIISNHHILFDGWSTGIILKEFFQAYDKLCRGEPVIPSVKTKFKEFIKWSQQREASREVVFWKNHLKGVDRSLGLPVRPKSDAKGGEREVGPRKYRTRFEKGTVDKLMQFTVQHKVTLAALLYSAWGVLLQRYTNSDDVLFGTTVSGRTAGIKGIEDMVGLFINTVPLRVHSIQGENITTLIRRTGKILRQREPYSAASLVDIKKYSEIDSRETLFDTIMVLENYPLDRRLKTGGKLAVRSYSMVEQTHYDVTVGITKKTDHIDVVFNYREELFEKEALEGMAHHWECILGDIIENPDQEVQDIDMLSPGEKKQVLLDFNNTESHFPADKTLHELFEQQMEKTPDSAAVIGKGHGCMDAWMHGNISITYRELNQKSNQLAYLLQERGVLADDIVGIMVERSIEMIIGILGILKAGGAYLPIDLEYPAERIKFIMADSGAKILLTNLSEGHHIHHSSFITHHSGNLAYVIYTSGSTGSPRGVLVEHGGVVNTLYWRTNEYRLGTDDAVLQLFSFSFDGFVTSFFTPILSGSRVVLLAEGQQGDVFRIKDTAIKEKVTHFICVPSLYASLLDLCSSGDLAGIRVVTLAGEPVKPALVKKSKALNPGIEIINEYGATENTVVATICRNVREKPLIPIGKPIANTRIYILSLHGNLNPIGIPGELCIAGPGVARGYLNNPELTAQKFQIHNNRWYYRTNRTYIPSKKIYKTGDLARWLPDGNIEFLGRKDFQVKIRGFRIEPGEIEKQLSEHEAIKEALVIAREYETGEKYLCAYVVMNPHLPHSPNFLKEYLSGKLPDYMIPANIVLLEQIPLNPNGKVDIKALPEPEVTSLKEYIPPRNDTEKELVNIWADVLGIDNQRIGIVDDFFELGGHSLKATLLISRIQKVLKVKVHLEEIFKLPTIKKLSVYIMGLTEEKYVSIYPAEETEYYALSSSQQRIYFSHRMDRKAVLYNMPSAWALEGTVDINRLESTFKKLISRQESLRTSFKVIGVGEEVVQCIHDKVEFEIEYYELATEDTERKEEIIHNSKFIIQNSFIRPFDLSQAPLLRVGLIKLPASYFLLVDMHHIISDGVSVNIFVKEFTLLYEGEELPALRIQYKDYSRWEKKQAANDEQRKKIKKQESYWLDQFKEGIPLLDLRTDYPRPAIQNYEGKVTCFEMTSDETRALKKMALEQGTTLYMVLLAICTIMLSKISGKEVVVTGTAVAGRRHADLEPIIGIFINTLALINYPADDKTFILYLKEVKNRTLEAFDNQDYPFEELVNQVVKNRRVDRHPIFDVMFALQDVVKSELTLEGLTLTPYESDFITSKFDLALVAMEKDRKLRLLFQYCTKLFKEETIKRYARYFNEIATAVTINKHVKLKDINISHRLLSLESKTTFDQFDF